jgi:hypothetical protein
MARRAATPYPISSFLRVPSRSHDRRSLGEVGFAVQPLLLFLPEKMKTSKLSPKPVIKNDGEPRKNF